MKLFIIPLLLVLFTTPVFSQSYNRYGTQDNPRVIVFTRSDCVWSKRMVSYLNSQGYDFEEVAIDRSRENYSRFLSAVGKGKVPVVAVGEGARGAQFRGYNPEVVSQMLSDYGYKSRPLPDYNPGYQRD